METEVVDSPAPPADEPVDAVAPDADAPNAESVESQEVLEPVPLVALTPGQLAAPTQAFATAHRAPEARAQPRTRVYGRASLTLAGGTLLSGSVYDMTHDGISVFLDYRLPMRRSYTLRLSIFRNGRLHVLTLQAFSIHETLVGGFGFKHGFQFGANSDDVNESMSELLA